MSTYEPTTIKPVESRGNRPLPDRQVSIADTGSGLLVFADADEKPGRELVAFADVTDWDAVRGALQKRGLDVGATHHLPHLDVDDVPRSYGGVA